MQTAGEFLVYSCPSCNKRIFTQQRLQGRHGACPLCGASHLIGGGAADVLVKPKAKADDGITTAEEAPDRRGAKRVKPRHAAGVEVQPLRRSTGRPMGKEAVAKEAVSPLLDLSATGVGFQAQGVADSRSLGGFRAPYTPGDPIALALNSQKLGVRPRKLRAIVRRVEQIKNKRALWRVGAEFIGLTPEDQAFLADMTQ